MELNFLYNDGAHLKKISFNATEITDQTFLMSQVGGYRNGTKYVGWLPKPPATNFRETEPRYFGTSSYQSRLMGPGVTGDYSRFFPDALVTAINKFPAENTYTLTTSSNFLGTKTAGSQYYNGVPLLREVDGSYKKVCNLLWAYIPQPVPGQDIHAYVSTGFWGFSYPSDEFPNSSMYNPTGGRNEHQFTGEIPEIKMSLWIITVQDDVQGSVSYGREYKLLVQVLKMGADQNSNFVSFIDLRLLNGTDDQGQPIPNAADPKKNSTPTGWGGTRNTASSADTPGTAPAALKNSVNWGEHGIFLYKISQNNLELFTKCLWSSNLVDIFKNAKFSPATCVLAVHKLPYAPDVSDANETTVRAGSVEMNLTEASYHASAPGHPAVTYNTTPVTAYYIYAGQEQQSNEVSIEPFFNSFLDFEPYTQIHIRIPFVGMVQIPTSAVMGGKLKLNYVFDNRNGNFVCQIMTTSMRNMQYADANGWVILAQYTGCCSMPMSLTGNTQGGMATIGAITGFASSAVQLGVGIGTGNVGAGVSGGVGMLQSAIDFISAPHQTQLVGTVHAEASIMEDLTVRVLITRPVDVTPGEYQRIDGQSVFVGDTLIKQKGLAAYSGAKVKNYEGMTAGYILGNIEGATADEMAAIRNAFLGGVIV